MSEIITNLFCHNAHYLICKDVKISNRPSIKLLFSDGYNEQLIFFSTIKGKNLKKGHEDFICKGKKIKIMCPICKEELDSISFCSCNNEHKMFAVYTDKKRNLNNSFGVCTNLLCKYSLADSAWKIIAKPADKNNDKY